MNLDRIATLVPVLLMAFASGLAARDPAGKTSPGRASASFARPIELGPDDVRVFPDAPTGFDQPRPGVTSGRVEVFAYDSTVTGTRREANVYLPPGYSSGQKYPVLFLLHGIAGNHHEWTGYLKAPAILDNLIADDKAVPMIVVMPSGRALPAARPPKEIYTPGHAAGFAKFERDLLDCLIPAIGANYAVLTDREHRALAGLSIFASVPTETRGASRNASGTVTWLTPVRAAMSRKLMRAGDPVPS